MRYALAGALLLAACGSGADVGPAPLFPEIGSHYTISGTFLRDPTTFTGTLLFVHPDSRTGDLQGSARLTLTDGDSVLTLPATPMLHATMTRDSLIAWTVPVGTASWTFDGFFEAGLIIGNHVLSGSVGTARGDFTAVEQ